MIRNVREDTVQVGDMKFHHISFGTGEKNLIMIQGLNTRGIQGAGLSMAYMYRMFAKAYRVHLFDRRPAVTPDITVRDMAADVAAVMDALGIQDADILGVSQGGMIAQYLAIDRPDLVHKLVLAVTLSRNNETVKRVINRWIMLTQQNRMRELVADMAERMYSPKYLKRYKPFLPLLTLLQKPKDIQRFLCLSRACLTCDSYEMLEQIRCPVLVIGGRQDQVVSGEASVELAEKLRCRIYMYEDLGHAAYEEAGDFNRRVFDFLQESVSNQ